LDSENNPSPRTQAPTAKPPKKKIQVKTKVPPPPLLGKSVVLGLLKAKPEYNGSWGVIAGEEGAFNRQSGRYTVTVTHGGGKGQLLNLKPENLREIPPGATPPADPAPAPAPEINLFDADFDSPAPAPAPTSSLLEPKKEQEEGMHALTSTIDGSAVYDPDKVDHSHKSEAVQQAVAERRRKKEEEMAAKREEFLNREAAKKQLQQDNDRFDAMLLPKLRAWSDEAGGKKKAIRALLCSLHTVMWEGCRWKELNMSKCLMPNQVKIWHRKANMVVHPDKCSGYSNEQVYIARYAFDALQQSWNEFAAKEMQ
jgi:hypothetical protein